MTIAGLVTTSNLHCVAKEAVQIQFLSEAVVLSVLGKTIGLIPGLISSAAIARILQWPTADAWPYVW